MLAIIREDLEIANSAARLAGQDIEKPSGITTIPGMSTS
jgi:hypothetical protein